MKQAECSTHTPAPVVWCMMHRALVPIGIAWTMVPGIVNDFVTTTSIEEMLNKNTVCLPPTIHVSYIRNLILTHLNYYGDVN